MKPSFLNQTKPPLVSMIQAATPEEAICLIVESLYDGADAFGIQLCWLKREYRTEETLRNIFSYCQNKPIYITSYRAKESAGMTDDECVELLLLGLKCGATLCDVMGDLYHPEKYELTFDEEAVAKQKALIDKIHEMGGEVLISSHVHTYFDEEQVMMYAKAQAERGADIPKIVSKADTEEEMMTGFKIITRLKNELGKPFLFLVGGAYSKLIRQVGPAFGTSMYLCLVNYRPGVAMVQPLLRSAKAIRDNMNF